MTDMFRDMAMTRTTVFRSNRTQAVRLPKDVAFPASVQSVTILRDGARRVIIPADRAWDDFFAAPGIDMGDRDQPPGQERELL
jgi:antitoxin VapB